MRRTVSLAILAISTFAMTSAALADCLTGYALVQASKIQDLSAVPLASGAFSITAVDANRNQINFGAPGGGAAIKAIKKSPVANGTITQQVCVPRSDRASVYVRYHIVISDTSSGGSHAVVLDANDIAITTDVFSLDSYNFPANAYANPPNVLSTSTLNGDLTVTGTVYAGSLAGATAVNAQHAATADVATTATTASTAVNASHATSADTATTASSATSATNATHANTATTANTAAALAAAPTDCGSQAATGINADGTPKACIAVGGVTPTGQQYAFASFTGSGSGSSTALGNSLSTTDATGKQLNTPILNGAYDAFKNQSGTGTNDGIAQSFTAGAKRVVAGSNYPATEAPKFGVPGTTFQDLRNGVEMDFCTPSAASSATLFCAIYSNQSTTRQTAGIAEGVANHAHNSFYAGFGNSDGNGYWLSANGDSGGTTYCFVPGLCSITGSTLYGSSDEDHIIDYRYLYYGFDAHSYGTEGNKYFAVDATEFPLLAVTTVASVTDQTHVRLSGISYGRTSTGATLGAGTILENMTDTVDSGSVTGYSAGLTMGVFSSSQVGLVTTSTTHSTSAAWGVSSTTLPYATTLPAGTATAMTMTNVSGTFPSSGDVCMFTGGRWFEAPFTATAASGGAQTVTVTSRYSNEGTTSLLVYGKCTAMHFAKEKRVDGSGRISAWPYHIVLGNPDSTHYWVVSTASGLLEAGRSPASPHASFNSNGNVVRASGTVTTTIDAPVRDFSIQGAPQLTITGCVDSSFNRTAASVSPVLSFDPATQQPSLSWNDSGTAATTTGCVFQVVGNSSFEIHDAAEIMNITDPAVNVPANLDINQQPAPINGYVVLAPNQMALSAGKTVMQPHGPLVSIADSVSIVQNSPAIGGRTRWYQGMGMSAPSWVPYTDIWYEAYAGGGATLNPNHFIGSGGQEPVPQYFWRNLGNIFQIFYDYQYAPAIGGAYVHLGCPPDGCSSTKNYTIFANDGYGFGSTFGFTPATNEYTFNSPVRTPRQISAPIFSLEGNGENAYKFGQFGTRNMFEINTTGQSIGVSANSGTSTAPVWNPGVFTAQIFGANGNGCIGFYGITGTGTNPFYNIFPDTCLQRDAQGVMSIRNGPGGGLGYFNALQYQISGVALASTNLSDSSSLARLTGGLLPIAQGGNASATPGITGTSGISVSGTWPNQVVSISSSGLSVAVTTGACTLTYTNGILTAHSGC